MFDNLVTLWHSLLNRTKVALLARFLPTETESVFMPKWQLGVEEERDEK